MDAERRIEVSPGTLRVLGRRAPWRSEGRTR